MPKEAGRRGDTALSLKKMITPVSKCPCMMYRTSGMAVANVIARYSRDCPQFSGKCIPYWTVRRSLLRRPQLVLSRVRPYVPTLNLSPLWRISNPLHLPMSHSSSHFKRHSAARARGNFISWDVEMSAQHRAAGVAAEQPGRKGRTKKRAAQHPLFGLRTGRARTWRKTVIAVRDPLRSCLLACVVSELVT